VLRAIHRGFRSTEHPLALFLDDLQWLDAATLDLLEDVFTRSDLRHLMRDRLRIATTKSALPIR